MKHLFRFRLRHCAVLFLLLSAVVCHAGRRDKVSMDAIASKMMNQLCSSRHSDGVSSVRPAMRVAATSSRLLNAAMTDDAFAVYVPADGRGFVVVSADDALPPVLAFSDDRRFASDDMPEGLRVLLDYYSAVSGTSSADALVSGVTSRAGEIDIQPLLGEIAFSQHEPFNNLCPMDGDSRCVTGCAATSMSEVMAYYRYPKQMQGENISYTSSAISQTVTWDCQNTTFDWDNLLPRYTLPEKPYSGGETVTDETYMRIGGIQLYEENTSLMLLTGFYNVTGATQNFDVQMILADTDGGFIRPVGAVKNIKELGAGWGYSKYYIEHSLPSSIADGSYRLYVGVRKAGTNVWSIAKTRSGSSWLPCYIDVRKSGRKYEISAETFTCGYTEAEGNAAAVLSGACGAAVQMNYSARGSSASTTNQRLGFFKYMDYDDGMTNLPFNTQSEQQFLDVIKDELSNGRIVFCCGVSEHNDAHAYNIDGMKTIDGLIYVHISWGWGGLDNGYYLLSNMAPPTQPQFGNFGYSYHLIVGVQPDDDVKNYPRFAMEKLETDKTNYKQGELLKVTLTKFYNYGCENFVGNHYIMLVDENGNMTNLGTLFSAESETKLNYGWPSYSRERTIPASIADGEYTVKIFSLPTALEGDFSKAYEMACPECPVVTVGNSTAVSVTERNPEGDAAPAYYNTSGQRLSVKPASGIVIERRGNRVVKRVGRN